MKWTVGKPQSIDSLPQGLKDFLLHISLQPRRRDINRLLKIRSFERIRLIKNRQQFHLSAAYQSFNCNLLSLDVTARFLPHYLYFRRAQQRPNAQITPNKLIGIIGSDYTSACRKSQGLQDARKA